jgi:hypothetical protein
MPHSKPAALAAVPAAPVACLRFPGFAAGEYEHADGVCACFRGGPPPRRAEHREDARLRRFLTVEDAALIWGASLPAVA